MNDAHFDSAYYGNTTLHPLGLAAVIVLGVAMLLIERRYAVWTMIIMACFVSSAQRIVVITLDFNLLRAMVLFGLLRLVLRGETQGFRWRPMDSAIICFALGHIAFALIREGTSILVYKLGIAYDIIGLYFLFRCLVRDLNDVKTVVLGFSFIVLPVAVAFAIERATARNVFSMFGGVSPTTMVRDGRLRCQGAFAHPILAGIFWASLLPLIVVQWWDGGLKRWLAVTGALASLAIVFACNSATPLTGIMFAVIGALAYRLRWYMWWVRWGIVAVLVGLHMVMKAPVWHLISRIDIVGGSGYHRYQLIDGAITHMNEWWLIGSRVGTAHWGHSTFDVTNTYVVQGLHGGLGLLGIFVLLLALAFRAVGRSWRCRGASGADVRWCWAMGVSLFIHVTGFIAITYFGQINMLWYLLLAMIASVEAQVVRQPGLASQSAKQKAWSLAREQGKLS